MTLSFLRLAPSKELAENVGNFWFMRGPGPDAMPEGHRILPDGCMEFVFQLGDPFRERRLDGGWRTQSHLLLVGQMERRVDVQPSGRIETVGVHFHPAGLAAFVAGDLSRFRGHITPLEPAIGEDLGPLVRRLKSAKTPEKMAAILEAFLGRRQLPGDPAMSRAAFQLSDPSSPIDVDAVARRFSLSERQFRRRFEAAVGLGPKRFSRLVRFQRVFEERQERDGAVWSDVALECGYYDQAHFNRDFRAFTGVKPRDIVEDDDPLTAFFLSVSSKTARAGPR
ncbi:MAG: helix-turn-helix transcriptional regulator [Vicinamibacteria bacterium]|nr:helix-turn-helix transcriptional regulator [Vicinamibacteria bacterium]